MNAYSARRPRSFDWAKAFLVSIIVHLLLVLLWVSALVFEFFLARTTDYISEPVIEPEAYRELSLEMVSVLNEATPQPEAPPAEQEPSFQSTRPSQEATEKIKSDRYFGERSTQAASESEAAESGIAVPNQEGREPEFANDLELADTSFADGENQGAPGLPGEPNPTPTPELVQQPEQSQEEQQAEETEAEETTEESVALETPLYIPTADERLEIAQEKAAKLLELEQSVAVPERVEQPDPVEEPAVEEAIPKPKPQEKPRALSGGPSGNRGAESGFEREASKTRVRGTIRRVGENAVDVEDTVKGRYLAEVNRAIERAWQRECILKREHIVPGVLTVTFILNDAGSVTGFRFDSRVEGGPIQEGFTMRAVQKAEIPSMPDEMQDELDGSALEMTLTFFF